MPLAVPWHRVNARGLVGILAVALAYWATGRPGLLLADVQENVTLIWPPTGVSLGALVLFGPRMAIGVALGSLALNTSIGTPLTASGIIAVGNTLEAVAGWAILRRFGFESSFSRMRDVFLLLATVLTASVVSATIGIAGLASSGLLDGASVTSVWSRWWAGDAAGGLIVTPLITVVAGGAPAWRSLYMRFETWIVVTLLVAGSSAAFLVDVGGLLGRGLALGLLVVLVWVGLRLGPRGAVIAGVVTSFIAVVGTGRGLGPFADPDMSAQILSVWAYMMTNGALALVLAAAVAERELAVQRMLASEREKRALESQMRHVQRLESLGVLAGGVAHDFNNLLTAVRGNASLLSCVRTPEDREQCIEQIDLAAIRASELCQQLLTYAGKARPRAESVDLAAMTDEMRMLLRSTVDKSVALEVEMDPTVSSVAGDPTLLRQIVLNLLMNASEAVGEASGSVRVSTRMQTCSRDYLDGCFLPSDAPAGEYVALIVEDDGCGMNRETLERVFDPFFSTKFTGRGLGLAAVLGVVHAHDGAIKVESEPGKGTRFVVLLPPSTTAPVTRENEEPVAHRISGRWLLVDDEDDVRSVAARVLTSLGAEVLEARDGNEAIGLLAEELDGLAGLLIDLTMPGKSGHEVIEWVRNRRGDLPIVLMSGYPRAESGSEDTVFLPKPFNKSELSRSLKDAVEAARGPAAQAEIAG